MNSCVMQCSPPNVSFRHDLFCARLTFWNTLVARLASIQLTPGSDEFRWNLCGNGKFAVDSMYRALVHSDIPVDDNKKIWQMKIPLKIKVFTWYLRKGVILTKYNLVKRNWHGSTKCIFILNRRQ